MGVSEMSIENIKLTNAILELVGINAIAETSVASFVGSLKHRIVKPDLVAYVCSDARFDEVRRLLFSIPDKSVAIFSSAGNVVHTPLEVPSIVIGHGNSNLAGCGAVGYAGAHGQDAEPELPAIANYVKGHPHENAITQLSKVGENFRVGAFYFNHAQGHVERVAYGDPEFTGLADIIIEILNSGLSGRYTTKQLEEMRAGQNPSIIYLGNLSIHPVGTPHFSVRLQRDEEIHGIDIDLTNYAMNHALHGHDSFKDTKTAIIALQDGRIPLNLAKLIDTDVAIGYMRRGGHIYVVLVAPNDTKTIYQISPR